MSAYTCKHIKSIFKEAVFTTVFFLQLSPLKDKYPSIPLFGFVPDSQRYFDFHHAPSDVFENVNKRELELGAAAIAGFVYLLDKTLP